MVLKCRFSISGLNAERKFNALIKGNIQVLNVVRQEKTIFFEVASKHKRAVQNFLKQNNCNFNCEYIGLALVLDRLKFKFGLMCGVALFIALLIFSSSVVMQVRITGNKNITNQQIMQVLYQNGVHLCGAKTNYDVEQIGNIIVDNFTEISFSSVIIRGNALVISVKENPAEKKPKYTTLKANCSGVITGLKIRRGTSLVKVGDVVQAGQIIVEPYEVLHGERVLVEPDAEVFATSYIKGEVQYNSRGFLRGRVGDEYSVREMHILGLRVPCVAKGDASVLLGEYEVEVEEQVINTILQVKQIITHYFKIGDTIKADYERDKEALARQSQYLALEQIDNKNDIKNISTQTIEVDGVYYITTYIEINKNILSE